VLFGRCELARWLDGLQRRPEASAERSRLCENGWCYAERK
jgi:hypothetical protein